MSNAIRIEFDLTDATAGLDQMLADSGGAVRAAAQAGAQVLYDEVKANVSRIGRKTGNLAASIYQAYSSDNSSKTRATYHISYNARKAPHGHLVEYGHIQTRKVFIGSDGKWYTSQTLLDQPKHVAARPFIRPAFDAKAQAALAAASERWSEEMRALLDGVRP